jgi:hypothetical protein
MRRLIILPFLVDFRDFQRTIRRRISRGAYKGDTGAGGRRGYAYPYLDSYYIF